MVTIDEATVKTFVESQLNEVDTEVAKLEAEIASLEEKLAEQKHKANVTREYFRLSFGTNSSDGPNIILLDEPMRFADMTQREVCREILREKGPLHVANIARTATENGKHLSSRGITPILIRGKEFERVPHRTNTFRLKLN